MKPENEDMVFDIDGEDVIDMVKAFGNIQKALNNLDRYDCHYSNEFRFWLRKEDYDMLIGDIVKERISLTPNAVIETTPGQLNPRGMEQAICIRTRNVFANQLLDIHQIAPYIHRNKYWRNSNG